MVWELDGPGPTLNREKSDVVMGRMTWLLLKYEYRDGPCSGNSKSVTGKGGRRPPLQKRRPFPGHDAERTLHLRGFFLFLRLSFQILDGGNTNVVLAQMDVQIAEQAIATKNHELNPSGIRLSGGVSGTLSSEDNNASGNVGLLYSAGNWSVGGSFSGSYDRATFTPSMTISGSWTNKTTKRSDDLALQKLNNDLISAQNDLIQARTSYIQNAQSLQIEVMQHNFTLQQAAANRTYLTNSLNYVQNLYDEGLATQQQLTDAQRELEWADVTDKVNTIDGLILQNRIAMLNI